MSLFGSKFNLESELESSWEELRTVGIVKNDAAWLRFRELLLTWIVGYDMDLIELTGDSKAVQQERHDKQQLRFIVKRLLNSLETTLNQEAAVRERITKLETIREVAQRDNH